MRTASSLCILLTTPLDPSYPISDNGLDADLMKLAKRETGRDHDGLESAQRWIKESGEIQSAGAPFLITTGDRTTGHVIKYAGLRFRRFPLFIWHEGHYFLLYTKELHVRGKILQGLGHGIILDTKKDPWPCSRSYEYLPSGHRANMRAIHLGVNSCGYLVLGQTAIIFSFVDPWHPWLADAIEAESPALEDPKDFPRPGHDEMRVVTAPVHGATPGEGGNS